MFGLTHCQQGPIRRIPVVLILAGILTILAALLLFTGHAVEGQTVTNNCPDASTDTQPLEVCLAKVAVEDALVDGVVVRSWVEVNRVVQSVETEDTLAEGAVRDNLDDCDITPCIRGGIQVWDSYFDPIYRADGSDVTDELIAFAIRAGEAPVAYERMGYTVCDDGIDDKNRRIRIRINPIFSPEYGYYIHRNDEETVTLNRNQDAGGTPCLPPVNKDTSTDDSDNNDNNPTWSVTANQTSISESGGASTITVSTGGATFDTTQTISLALSGSATAGSDYSLSPGSTLTLPANSTSVTATITAIDDTVDESNETITITARHDDSTIGSASVTIVDNDPPVEEEEEEQEGEVEEEEQEEEDEQEDQITPITITPVTITVACPPTCPSTQITLSVSPPRVDENAGQTDLTVTGRLNGNPRGSDTVVDLAISPGTAAASDFSSGTATLTIPAGQTSGTATMSFTPVDDAVSEENETVIVDGTTTSGLSVTTVTITIANDDTPGVTVSRSDLSAREVCPGEYTYTAVLDSLPAADVIIALAVEEADGDEVEEVTLSDATLTFTTTSWQTAHTVTVAAGDDEDFTNDTATISHTSTSADEGYNGLVIDSVAVTVYDDDVQKVVISEPQLWVVEERPEAATAYDVSLALLPNHDVIITIGIVEADGDDVEEVATSHTTLTFTPENWETPQTVTVSAGPDDDALDETATISHTATSDDECFSDLTIPSVSVTIKDDDQPVGIEVWETTLSIVEEQTDPAGYVVAMLAPPTDDVTINIAVVGDDEGVVTTIPTSLTFTSADWESEQSVAVSAGHDENEVDETVTITHTADTEDARYAALEIDSVAVSIRDNDGEAGVEISETNLWIIEEQTEPAGYVVALQSQPTDDVTITLGVIESDNDGVVDVIITPSSLTFTVEDWAKAQTVALSAVHDDDTVDDLVTITHAATSTDTSYDGLAIGIVAVTVYDNDAMAEVEVSPTAIWINEETPGAFDFYTVRLRSEPSESVTIAISADEEVTTTPDRLTFTVDQWARGQTVAVRAGHDDDTEDDRVTVTHAASSADRNYNGLDIDSVAVTVYDNDAEPEVAISPTALWIDEGQAGLFDTYTVRLRTEPSASVTITIAAGGEVTTSPNNLTFSSDNWGTERTVTVSAGHDVDTDDDQVTITHAASSADSNYNGLNIDSVAVTVYDDDATPAVAIDPTALWIDEGQAGLFDTYTVRLRTEPTGTVNISISAEGEVTTEYVSLIFTADDWRTARTVTVSAGHDTDAEDDDVTITHSATSSDSDYNGLSIDSVAVTVYDDDPPAVEQRAVTPRVELRPTATPAPTPAPTAAPPTTPVPTATRTLVASSPELREPGSPELEDTQPRDGNLLERAADAGRDRLTLVILIAIALIGAGLTFTYLIVRRR